MRGSHRDLKAEVAASRFREDLYYRLNVFSILAPSLRDRPEDIPLLAGHFLERLARVHHRPIAGFEPAALAALSACSWPGNVRELENVVERAGMGRESLHRLLKRYSVRSEDYKGDNSATAPCVPNSTGFSSAGRYA